MNKIVNDSINEQLNISCKSNKMENNIVFVGPEGVGKTHSILYWVTEQQ